jgi:hypothetical protein
VKPTAQRSWVKNWKCILSNGRKKHENVKTGDAVMPCPPKIQYPTYVLGTCWEIFSRFGIVAKFVRDLKFHGVTMSMLLFCVVTQCGLVGRYQRFRYILSPSSALKMVRVSSSEMLMSTYNSAHHKPEDQYRHLEFMYCIPNIWCMITVNT